MTPATRTPVASLFLLVAMAFPAWAQTPSEARGLENRGCCLEDVESGARVADLKIRGNEELSSERIKNAIFTTESGSFPWSQKHSLDKQQFLDDLRRLYVLYHRNGYFDFELTSYEIRQDGDDVRVVFRVEENLPTRVEELTLEGFGAIDGADLEEQLRERLPLKERMVFNERDLLASQDTLENAFKNRGYAFAQVLLEYRIRKPERSATIIYSVDPGDQYYFGEISVDGTGDASDEDLVRDQLVLDSGELYEKRKVDDSQRRIYELGLFRLVDVEPRVGSVRGDTIDVSITVAPAPTRLVRFGVGYGTEDLVRVQGSWLDRNFFGRSRQLEVRGLYSRLERESAVTYRQPTFFDPDLGFALSTFLRFETEENYTVQRLGSSLTFVYRVGRTLSANAGLTAERADFSDFDRGVLVPELGRDFIDPSRLLNADFGVSYDGADSLFSPTSGSRARFSYQIGIPVASFDYAYNKVTVEVTRYHKLTDGWVVAGKILPGAIFTYSGDPDSEGGEGRVPLFERLFAGGSTSVRGYERRQLGPTDDPAAFGQDRRPEPIGGAGLFETSVELRFPVKGNFRGAAFLDAGNVWDDPSEISLGDLKYAPGLGLRYSTPVGPLRLDVAHRLSDEDPERELPNWVFHISIGNAY